MLINNNRLTKRIKKYKSLRKSIKVNNEKKSRKKSNRKDKLSKTMKEYLNSIKYKKNKTVYKLNKKL
jgi:hypothetical protein